MEEEVPGLPVDPLVPVTKAHFRLNLVPKVGMVPSKHCPPCLKNCLKMVWSSRSSFGSCDGSVTSKVWRHFRDWSDVKIRCSVKIPFDTAIFRIITFQEGVLVLQNWNIKIYEKAFPRGDDWLLSPTCLSFACPARVFLIALLSKFFNQFNFLKQGPAYKKEGPDPNKGSN